MGWRAPADRRFTCRAPSHHRHGEVRPGPRAADPCVGGLRARHQAVRILPPRTRGDRSPHAERGGSGRGRMRLESPSSPRTSRGVLPGGITRSEEHTSELQSLAYLVCRLLLEKKKYNEEQRTHTSYRTEQHT